MPKTVTIIDTVKTRNIPDKMNAASFWPGYNYKTTIFNIRRYRVHNIDYIIYVPDLQKALKDCAQ